MGLRDTIRNIFALNTSEPQEDVAHSNDWGFFPLSDIRSIRNYGELYSVAYLACEQTKSIAVGSIPVAVYHRSNGKREEVDGHPLSNLLKGMANDLMSGQDLLHWTILRRDTFGDAYWWVEWYKGEPIGLHPILGNVSITYSAHAKPGRRVRYKVSKAATFSNIGVTVPEGTYFSDEVIHFKTPITKDGIRGESRAQFAAQEIGLSIDLEKFYRSLLDNGNHHLGHVEVGDIKGPDSAKVVESLKRAIEAKSGVDKAGKAPIFGYGAKWVQDSQTMKDAALIEQQQWVLEQVCRATNVPPSKIYDLAHSNYSSAESARIDFVTDTIAGETKSIETPLRNILTAMGDKDCYVRFDLNGLMRGDSAARGQFYREMVYLGAMTRADVREKEDLNPIEGLDKPLFPLNYGQVESDGSITVVSASKEPSDGMQTGATDD